MIVNVHALSSGSECLKELSQPESLPAPSTDQLTIESKESPSQLVINSQLSAVRVEEQTVDNGISSELSDSPMAEKQLELAGRVDDGIIGREGEGDGRAKSTEHIEIGELLNPQLSANRETSSEVFLSADQKSGDGGCVNDTKDRESESESSANSTECIETAELPPGPSSREDKFEGDHISDDTDETESEGDRSVRSALPDEAMSHIQPVMLALNGREEQASSELLDQDDTGNTSDVEDEEKFSGNKEGESNSGQEREIILHVTNHSSGSPSEMDGCSVLESGDRTEMAHCHDNIDQHQEHAPPDSALPVPIIDTLPSQEDISDSKKQKEILYVNTGSDEIEEAIATSTNQLQVQQECTTEMAVDITDANTSLSSVQQERNNSNPFDLEKEELLSEEDTLTSNSDVYPTNTPTTLILPVVVPEAEAEDHTKDLSSVHCGAVKKSSEPPEEVNKVEKKHSQTGKNDFEAVAKEIEHVMDYEDIGDHLETIDSEANGDKGEDDFKASAKELKHVVDQEDTRDHLETEELNGDKEDVSKHEFETAVPAKELECIMHQEDVGYHLDTRKSSEDKGKNNLSTKKLGDQEDTREKIESGESGEHLETKKLSRDKREDSSDDDNDQLPDSVSVVDHDDKSHLDLKFNLGDVTTEKHTAVHLASMTNLEDSSSIKSTSRQSESPSKSPVSDLDTFLSSQEEENEMSTEADKSYTPESSHDNGYITRQERERHDEKAGSSSSVPVESHEEIFQVSHSSYEEVAPEIKCTFVGRTIKTVSRTSADRSINHVISTTIHNENHIANPPLESSDAEYSESTKKSSIEDNETDTVIENDSPSNSKAILGTPMHMQESKFGTIVTESPLGQKMINKTLPPLKAVNVMEFTNQERESADTSEPQTSKQQFPYKFETVV